MGACPLRTQKHILKLSALNMMSETEVLTWEKTHKINSLAAYFIKAKDSDFEIEHVDLINFPVGHTSVLNSNAEVKIGDTIVWYNQGIKYYFPNNDEKSLKSAKESSLMQNNLRLRSEYKITKLDLSSKAMDNSRINVPAGNGVGTNGYQFTFPYCQNGTSRKYIHELYSVLDGQIGFTFPNGQTGYNYHTSLTLRIKLEYRTSKGKWLAAGENRKLDYYVTSSLRHFASAPSIVVPLSGYYVTAYSAVGEIRNTDKTITLFNNNSLTHYTGDPNPYYDVELSGYITQSILNGSAFCNPYTSPYAGANSTSLLW